MLDPKRIFETFNTSDVPVLKEAGIEDPLSNPEVVLGTVIIGMQNYEMLNKFYRKKYGKEYTVQLEKKIKYKYFNGLYTTLLTVEPVKLREMLDHEDFFTKESIVKSLSTMIDFFESPEYEQYEKCAGILKFLRALD